MTQKARALLDCGSESSFITKTLKDQLSLDSNPIDALNVIGIGNVCNDKVRETCITQITSLNSQFTAKLSCLVMNKLTSDLPKIPIDVHKFDIPQDINLADPTFNQPGTVDILIGSDLFWEILGNEKRSLGPNKPILIKSKLGWLIAGPTHSIHNSYNKYTNCHHSVSHVEVESNIDSMLKIFWEIEELPKKTVMSKNDKICEQHFIDNTVRLNTGRFCIKLPLTDSTDCLGDTFYLARKRFLCLERRFKRQPKLKLEYSNFIKEYAKLGHLSECPILKPNPAYFLCHHAVFKNSSESTKLRVVFDGSAPSSSGYSLNDILMVGPNVQDSLFSILVRARQYKYLLTGDIEKMYRQVQVKSEDRNLQLILWREDESQPIRTLQLNTLTYGTASASYLSTRCIKKLGEEQEEELISSIIQRDFYIDDLVTGSNDAVELRYIQNRVSEILLSGCFNLRKYRSNLENLFENSNIDTQQNLTISESSNTLGLGWDPSNDCLHFPINFHLEYETVTKRVIMSNSFKLFDPLGILSPCIIKPKMMLQKLWLQKIDWDEPVPYDIREQWINFIKNMPCLLKLQIPRWVICDSPVCVELHSFSDASQSAYGACVYVRSIDANNDITVRLLCAKSKVAPVKPMTIPRLELSAALLAARLCRDIETSIRYTPDRIIHWCDSSVVLSWINNDVTKLKSFVANRISEIVELTHSSAWRYVPTTANPADLISRGLDGNQIIMSNLWWTGPSFLFQNEAEWPILKSCTEPYETLPEINTNIAMLPNPIIQINRYSNLTKLQRILAYVMRFIYNLKNNKNQRSGKLTINELNEAFIILCGIAQQEIYPIELNILSNNKMLSSKSKILQLSPFLDDHKLIRVGGRIHASNCTYEQKHPILLHASHHLTKLIFEREHISHMHAGPQLLLAVVREIVWPVNGRHLARRVVNNCVRCRRLRGKTLCPKMGNLPSQRITPDFPFLSVGLDFAGPFHILNRKGRGSRLIKAYLCLFVCLRYKCIHLEAVNDLSKESFIMTLKRFVARRGKPLEIFCDNGRNFVAAAKELGEFLKSNIDSVSDFANHEGFKFIFTPTYAPHFGGIWEAGVKSAKGYLKRVIGNSHLTFEEISTLFSQVEAVLNSRPLCPLSSPLMIYFHCLLVTS
ncbi:uncharacterized protein LOC131847604 [Achroia grisella]|uniref:uncharacterized protein LOC131847604 n=1 Tax=Achroia grisella TaxID=688607 RepID=UPI0027D33615|nr:uncharacterized protein LOC131847604 [Achroia grisella]